MTWLDSNVGIPAGDVGTVIILNVGFPRCLSVKWTSGTHYHQAEELRKVPAEPTLKKCKLAQHQRLHDCSDTQHYRNIAVEEKILHEQTCPAHGARHEVQEFIRTLCLEQGWCHLANQLAEPFDGVPVVMLSGYTVDDLQKMGIPGPFARILCSRITEGLRPSALAQLFSTKVASSDKLLQIIVSHVDLDQLTVLSLVCRALKSVICTELAAETARLWWLQRFGLAAGIMGSTQLVDIHSSPISGQGLFANCHLASGSFVLEYYGQLDVDACDWDSDDDSDSDGNVAHAAGPDSAAPYFFSLDRPYFLNPKALLEDGSTIAMYAWMPSV